MWFKKIIKEYPDQLTMLMGYTNPLSNVVILIWKAIRLETPICDRHFEGVFLHLKSLH